MPNWFRQSAGFRYVEKAFPAADKRFPPRRLLSGAIQPHGSLESATPPVLPLRQGRKVFGQGAGSCSAVECAPTFPYALRWERFML